MDGGFSVGYFSDVCWRIGLGLLVGDVLVK